MGWKVHTFSINGFFKQTLETVDAISISGFKSNNLSVIKYQLLLFFFNIIFQSKQRNFAFGNHTLNVNVLSIITLEGI